MTKYDCRKPANGRDPEAKSFPCPVEVRDALTGERIKDVFFLDTTGRVGRFLRGPDDEPLAKVEHTAKRVQVGDAGRKIAIRGGRRIKMQEPQQKMDVEVQYTRLEHWERRAWVAVAMADRGGFKSGEVVDRSETVDKPGVES